MDKFWRMVAHKLPLTAAVQCGRCCSLILQQFQKDGLRQFFEVFALRHDIEVDHGVVDAHALQLNGLVHIRQVEQLYHIVDLDQADEVLFAESLQSVKSVLVGCHEHVNGLVRVLNFDKLVRVDELEQLFECWQANVLHTDHLFLCLTHTNTEHIFKEIASRSQDTLVRFNFGITYDKGHVSEVLIIQHLQQVLW